MSAGNQIMIGALGLVLFLRFGPNLILWMYFLSARFRVTEARREAHREKIAADEVEARVAELRRRLGK